MEALEQKQAKITELLKEKHENPEKAKDEIERILGKGHRSIKELTDEQADKVLEELYGANTREIKDEKELKKIKESALPIPLGVPSGPLATLADDRAFNTLTKVMEKVHNFALNTLKSYPSSAFVLFGDAVCLRGAWIDKFLTSLPLPIEVRNKHELPQDKTPNGYPVFRFEADAVNTLTGMSMPVYSEESSEKDFYTTRYVGRGENRKRIKLAPDQVNLRDVRMAAYRGIRKEIIKAMFGLRSLTIQEAKEKGIKGVERAFKVPFKSGGK